MADVSEAPTVLSAWLLAIPSSITALSMWYTRSKVNASDKKTGDKVDEAAKAQAAVIEAQTKVIEAQTRVINRLEGKVDDTHTCVVNIAAKHTETMSEATMVMQKLEAGKATTSATDVGKVETKDLPKQPLGKVILKD